MCKTIRIRFGNITIYGQGVKPNKAEKDAIILYRLINNDTN